MEKIENREYKAHVLLFPYPVQGHINPMLQFSKRLASKGLKATLATTLHIANSSPRADPNHHLVQIHTISDGYDRGGPAEAESVEAYAWSFKRVGSRTLGELIAEFDRSGHPVSALIFDSSIDWAVDVAKRFGLLKVAFFTQSCAVSSVYYHVNKGLLELPLSGDVVSLPGLVPLCRFDLPSFVSDPGSYPVFFDVVVGQFDRFDELDWVLHNSFYESEPEAVDWMAKICRLRTIGPMVPSTYIDKRIENDTQYGISIFNPNSSDCKKWLHKKPNRSVVYVSFGSVATLSTQQVEEIACALHQSGYYFLWVVRESEQTKLPTKFKEETSEKGLVVTWCQQLEVLADESIGCFVTHCGFNSVLEALSLGVPIVAAPQWIDQPTNAKFVEDVWGIGVRAWPDENGVVRRGELEVRLREVMEGERGKMVKKNATEWMNLAKQAMGQGGSSDKNIDEFVANLERL